MLDSVVVCWSWLVELLSVEGVVWLVFVSALEELEDVSVSVAAEVSVGVELTDVDSFSTSLIMVVVVVEWPVSVFDFESLLFIRFMMVKQAMTIERRLAIVAIVFCKAEKPVLISAVIFFPARVFFHVKVAPFRS